MRVTPDGWGGNFFNDWSRSAYQQEVSAGLSVSSKEMAGPAPVHGRRGSYTPQFFRNQYLTARRDPPGGRIAGREN